MQRLAWKAADHEGPHGVGSGHLQSRRRVFYVQGHAFDTALMDAMFDAARRFFTLPLNIKRALARDRVGDNRGFVDLDEERLDLNSLPDRKEAFNIGLERAIDCGIIH
jgi:isopenicillin N synthase-like dioxygenase